MANRLSSYFILVIKIISRNHERKYIYGYYSNCLISSNFLRTHAYLVVDIGQLEVTLKRLLPEPCESLFWKLLMHLLSFMNICVLNVSV